MRNSRERDHVLAKFQPKDTKISRLKSLSRSGHSELGQVGSYFTPGNTHNISKRKFAAVKAVFPDGS